MAKVVKTEENALKISNVVDVLNDEAVELLANGIKTQMTCDESLKYYFRLRQIVNALLFAARRYGKTVAALEAAAGKYANAHPKYVTLGDFAEGVRRGHRETQFGKVRLSVSDGTIKRKGGENLTADFLSGLPKDWTKTRLELDLTAIDRLDVSEKVLNKNGLCRVPNYTWSIEQEELK